MLHARTDLPSPRLARGVVDWGAVWSGALVGAGVMTMVSALWLALGFGSGVSTFHDGIEWWLAATGIGSVLVGGFVAGATSRWGGTGRGTMTSIVMWALLAVPAAFVTMIVAAANHVTANSAPGVLDRVGNASLWAAWWSMLIGLGSAVLGGVLGGATRGAATSDADFSREGNDQNWAYPPGTPENSRHVRTGQYSVRD
jgi:hypothetical protein